MKAGFGSANVITADQQQQHAAPVRQQARMVHRAMLEEVRPDNDSESFLKPDVGENCTEFFILNRFIVPSTPC